MGEYVYMVQLDVANEADADFNRIYDTEHMPLLTQVAGCSGARRYKLVSSTEEITQRYVAIYEIDSPDLPKSDAWQQAANKGEWRTKVKPHVRNAQRHIFERVG
jgi:hypothetical protein